MRQHQEIKAFLLSRTTNDSALSFFGAFLLGETRAAHALMNYIAPLFCEGKYYLPFCSCPNQGLYTKSVTEEEEGIPALGSQASALTTSQSFQKAVLSCHTEIQDFSNLHHQCNRELFLLTQNFFLLTHFLSRGTLGWRSESSS